MGWPETHFKSEISHLSFEALNPCLADNLRAQGRPAAFHQGRELK
jgi:hypothetical protein